MANMSDIPPFPPTLDEISKPYELMEYHHIVYNASHEYWCYGNGNEPEINKRRVEQKRYERGYYYWFRLRDGWAWFRCRSSDSRYTAAGILTFDSFIKNMNRISFRDSELLYIKPMNYIDKLHTWLQHRVRFTFVCICRHKKEYYLPKEIIQIILTIFDNDQ